MGLSVPRKEYRVGRVPAGPTVTLVDLFRYVGHIHYDHYDHYTHYKRDSERGKYDYM